MWVCLCRGITSRAIEDVIADGAATVEEIVVRSGAGLRCQGCRPTLEAMLGCAGSRCDAMALATTEPARRSGLEPTWRFAGRRPPGQSAAATLP
jgi:bacterioferritin-associated ferredoxin